MSYDPRDSMPYFNVAKRIAQDAANRWVAFPRERGDANFERIYAEVLHHAEFFERTPTARFYWSDLGRDAYHRRLNPGILTQTATAVERELERRAYVW